MAMLRMQSCNLTSSNTTTNNKGVHLFGFLISHCHLLRFSNSRTLHSSHRRRRIPTSPIYCLSKSNCCTCGGQSKFVELPSESFISKAVVRVVILLWGEKSSMSSEVLEGVPIFNYKEILFWDKTAVGVHLILTKMVSSTSAILRSWRKCMAHSALRASEQGDLHPMGPEALESCRQLSCAVRGENVEPSILEEAAEQSKVIQQILVIGQDQRRLGALIFPNKEEILALAKELSMVDEDASEVGKEKENMINLLQKELCTCDIAILENSSMNKPVDTQSVLGNTETLYQFYNGGENRSLIEAFNPTSGCTFQIGPILILNEPFTIESGLMTPTMKIRRDSCSSV